MSRRLPLFGLASVLVVLASFPERASALSGYVALVPNGNRIGCNLCHTAGGGTPRNAFGTAFAGSGHQWAPLYNLDSDGDGYTNGEEVGDPDGDGTGDPLFAVSNPGLATSIPCGSNTIEGPEVRDGAQLGGETCATQGFVAGTLGCNATCTGYVTTGCNDGTPPPGGCGDGTLDTAAGEQCDSGLDNSDTTPNACRTDCTLPTCGDGVIDGSEQCDDGLANSNTVAGACRTNCVASVCGDGVLDAGEDCDQGTLNSNVLANHCRLDCTDYGCGDNVVDSNEGCDNGPANSAAGPCTLACALLSCGNNTVEAGEQCDNGPLNSNTVPDACRATCRAAACGDQVDDTGEECDWGPFASDTSPDSCRTDCSNPSCGDGVIDTYIGETCDAGNRNVGSAIAGECRSLDCHRAACGDSVQDADEECDDGNATDGDGCDQTCVSEIEDEETPPPSGCTATGATSWAGLLVVGLAALWGRRRR